MHTQDCITPLARRNHRAADFSLKLRLRSPALRGREWRSLASVRRRHPLSGVKGGE
jgi:hypothetical protein